MATYYRIPEEYYHRLHFVRSRFKDNIESILLYFANACCKIAESDCKTYAEQVNNAIRIFRGNATLAEKTINNWRTEISALCAFYIEDKTANVTKTSKLSFFLNENQDLTQFFKFLMLSFQFPGGHIKAVDNIDLIHKGVRFKPAQYILNVLLEGNKILSESGSMKEMTISDEEATFCIFDDLRVTRGERTPKETAALILDNRKKKIKYYNREDKRYYSSKGKPRSKKDVVRYAGDVLDYMEYASLLERRQDGYFHLKPNELKSITEFIKDKSYFDGYEQFYGIKRLKSAMLAPIETEWFTYVDDLLDPNKFKTDVEALLSATKIDYLLEERLSEIFESETTTTKDIGNLGETIVLLHEKMRLKVGGFKDLVDKVMIVDSPSYHPGYDIVSREGDGTKNLRYIEVKTTISRKNLTFMVSTCLLTNGRLQRL